VNKKAILLLTAALIVLLVIIGLIENEESSRLESEGVLFTVPVDGLLRLELLRDGEKIVFVRDEKDWRIDFPLKARIDRGAIDNIIDSYSKLRFDGLVEETALDLARYGLDEPRLELRIYTAADSVPERTLLIGQQNPLDNSYYARLENESKVVLLPSFRVNYLDRELFDFREKKVLDLSSLEVDSFNLEWRGKSFSFFREEGRWWIKKPLSALARKTKIDEILGKFAGLQAKEFIQEKAEKAFNLDKPILKAVFQLRDGGQSELIISRREDDYFAKAPALAEICRVGDDLPAVLSENLKDYREHKLLDFYPFAVKKITITGTTWQTALYKDEEEWKFEDQAIGLLPDQDKVRDLLYDLQDLEADSFVDNPSLAADSFNLRLSLLVEDKAAGKEAGEMEVLLGPGGTSGVLARNPALGYDFLVNPEILAKLPKETADLLPEAQQEEEADPEENDRI